MNAKAILHRVLWALSAVLLLTYCATLVYAGADVSLRQQLMRRGEVYALLQDAEQVAAAADFATAVDLLNAAIALDPAYPAALLRRGQMHLALFEWDAALRDFNAALAVNPVYADAYFQRGLLYFSVLQSGAQFYDEALADFRTYLQLASAGRYAERARAAVTTLEAYFAG
jgi:tetratricopeptide (TPR) repeat protein